ncbi:hypothetical protein IMZ48_10185 [Candidatus Bathyarchaeota archaeon]|nr:hypothetical protein [Candidatus Bathyarchaeota archaeon]
MVRFSFPCSGCGKLCSARKERKDTGNGEHIHYFGVDSNEGPMETRVRLYEEGAIGFYVIEFGLEIVFREGTVPEFAGGNIYILESAELYPHGDWTQPRIEFKANPIFAHPETRQGRSGQPDMSQQYALVRYEPDLQHVVPDQYEDDLPSEPRPRQHRRDDPARSRGARRSEPREPRQHRDDHRSSRGQPSRSSRRPTEHRRGREDIPAPAPESQPSGHRRRRADPGPPPMGEHYQEYADQYADQYAGQYADQYAGQSEVDLGGYVESSEDESEVAAAPRGSKQIGWK